MAVDHDVRKSGCFGKHTAWWRRGWLDRRWKAANHAERKLHNFGTTVTIEGCSVLEVPKEAFSTSIDRITMEAPTLACIIGAGPGGIAMAHQMKHKLKCDDFVIVDQNDGPGGTWYSNTYPGCGMHFSIVDIGRVDTDSLSGCDVPSHFYSFSFALNPDWSRPLAEQGEILECMFVRAVRWNVR